MATDATPGDTPQSAAPASSAPTLAGVRAGMPAAEDNPADASPPGDTAPPVPEESTPLLQDRRRPKTNP